MSSKYVNLTIRITYKTERTRKYINFMYSARILYNLKFLNYFQKQ